MAASACEFCTTPGGPVLWESELCRVVRVDEPDYPGFVRVILGRHATEMAELGAEERRRLMEVVFAVEAAVRETMGADKMNLASLGNQTPHVHWHVVPRFRDDRHFPGPIWAAPKRAHAPNPERERRSQDVSAAVVARLKGLQ
ncbi:MAG TPA: HIT family protein [Usitatibacter sp.]|jgi:diadenosine tetraphosphate (Ap4A) HIT family hydrolase|nr:HIT family protein [Usitatibacter sp.]